MPMFEENTDGKIRMPRWVWYMFCFLVGAFGSLYMKLDDIHEEQVKLLAVFDTVFVVDTVMVEVDTTWVADDEVQ